MATHDTIPALSVWNDFIVTMYKELQDLRERVAILESGGHTEWLTRTQAMAYLCCKDTKLWELGKEGTITKSGRLYGQKSCRDYLLANATSKEVINKRLAEIVHSKHTTKK